MLKSTLKRILPQSWLHAVARGRETARYLLAAAFAWSGWTASIYYVLLSGSFRREQLAVLQGRCRYYRRSRREGGNVYRLRRNVHRLEKGLIMRPRRPSFAADYIEETVQLFHLLADRSPAPNADLQWAGDVLTQYFASVQPTPAIERARSSFLARCGDRVPGTCLPRERGTYQAAAVRFDDLLELARRRRSVRWYARRDVPRSLLDQAVQVAALSPSACNRQPYRFVIFDRAEDAAAVGSVAGGTAGFSANFNCLVVVVAELDAYADERDRHLIYIDSALACMSFMLALETVGLSSCPINWPDVEDREARIRQLLELRPDERVIMLVSVGYADPAGGVPASAKRDLDLIRSYWTLQRNPAQRPHPDGN